MNTHPKRLIRGRGPAALSAYHHSFSSADYKSDSPAVIDKEDDEEDQRGSHSKASSGKQLSQQRLASRRFLTHPGVPEGTLFQREMMAGKLRMQEVKHKVHKHKLKRMGLVDDEIDEESPSSSDGKDGVSGPRRAQSGIMSVVEDKIQLSMIRGEFSSLAGKGKPLERLDRERTPGVDRTVDLFMDVLQRNGVVPEWIERGKRVREMESLLARRIAMEMALVMMEANPEAEKSPDLPLVNTPRADRFAARVHDLASIREDLAFINREVDTYNIQVPAVHLQRLRIKIDPMISEALLSPPRTYGQAYQQCRAAQRDGSMGVTCLMEYRADHLGDGDGFGGSAWGSDDGRQCGEGGQGRYYAGFRKRREEPAAHLFHVVMLPVDGLASFLAKLIKGM